MKKSLLVFALLLSVGVQTAMAQTKAKGKIVDAEGLGVPGAAIKVVGTTSGTMTDVDGNFEIDVPEGGKVTVNALGFGEQTLTPNDHMTVTLSQGENILTDVVVTQPYGPAITKEKYTGAADVITAKQIERMPVSDITKAIEGAAPGVQVTNGSGQPGSGAGLRIRGAGSLSASNAPLIVLDGTPYIGDLTSINPNDVESMTILKDATATTLYGSRGSNGVIVITTKRGKRGERPAITVDGKVGTVTRSLPNYDIIQDPKLYYETSWRGVYNNLITGGASAHDAGLAASGYTTQGVVDLLGYNNYYIPGVDAALQNASLIDTVTGKLNPNAVLKYHDDWVKAMQRTGLRQDYNVNVSGGTDKTDFYLSAGYLNEKGFLLNSDYSRFSTRLNVNSQIADWLKVGMNLSGAMSTQNGLSNGSNSGSPTYIGQTMPIINPVYWRDENGNKVIDPATGKDKLEYGSLVQDPNFSTGQRANLPGSNIVGEMQLNQQKTKTNNITVAPYIEARLSKDFTFRTTLGANYLNQTGTNWTTTQHGQYKSTDTSLGGRLSIESYNQFTYTWNENLGFHHTFNKDHEVTVNLIHENYYFHNSDLNGSNTGYPNDDLRELSVGTGTQIATSSSADERMESYIAAGNYIYKGKYILNANFRRDGLSRFSPDNRWGNFASIGGAWLIKQENFLKDVSWIDNLKLKVSYGTQGNNAILDVNGNNNYYAYQGLYDVTRPNGNNFAAIPISLINNNLKWETQKQLNIGAEFDLFHSRLSGEINVYNRQTSGLYYNVPNPPSTGFPNILQNAASKYNRGIELNLYGIAAKTRNFEWDVNLNLTKFKTRLTSLAPGVDSFISGNFIYKPGYSDQQFYLVHSAGVDKTNGDELYSYRDASGNVKDTNNYAYATANGRIYAGLATPSLTGAITNTFKYKGFELSFLISFSVGGKYLDNTYQALMSAGTAVGGGNFSKDILNSWTADNPNATLPRIENANTNIAQTSDRFLVSASYLNFRNLNLRYRFPSTFVSKAGFTGLSAYIAADNLALVTARKGMNPQNSFSGISDYVYQPARTIMVGVTLGL